MAEFLYAGQLSFVVVYDATAAAGHGVGKLFLLLVGGIGLLVVAMIAKFKG